MYAVISAGGKQYRVAPGDKVRVETIPAEVGAEIELTGCDSRHRRRWPMLTGTI